MDADHCGDKTMTTTPFKMNFNNFPGSQGYVPNGYQGFDFSEMFYANPQSLIDPPNTGYYNDLHGRGEAFCVAEDNVSNGYGWGAFYSPTKETFTLKSGDFASAWDQEQSVKFTTYRGSQVIASNYITVSIYGQKIDFAHYGADFKNITKVRFATNYNYAVNQSSVYGTGWQVVVDNLKGVWNGKKPAAFGAHHQAHVNHPLLAAATHGGALASSAHNGHSQGAHFTFHSALSSLDTALGHHNGGGLTAEFSLPGATEHFGFG
jgi:hypothetical protein